MQENCLKTRKNAKSAKITVRISNILYCKEDKIHYKGFKKCNSISFTNVEKIDAKREKTLKKPSKNPIIGLEVEIFFYQIL